MPVKTKKIHHSNDHDKHGHRRNKKFLKVYAPYLPLSLIVATGLFLSLYGPLQPASKDVLGYGVNTSDQGLLQTTNENRIKNNLSPLQLNQRLDTAAQAKANDMAKHDYWSHNSPSGQEPWTFIDQTGYKFFRATENLAYGFDSSEATLDGWMNSPPHKANVLDGDISEVGFGIVNVADFQNTGPQTIVVAMYARPVPSSAATTTKPVSNDFPAVLADQNEQKVSYLQTITNGQAPWLNFAVGLLIGGIITFLIIRHARRLHRMIKRGERFILHHPLLDITLIALLALAVIVSQTAGTIH